MRQGRGARRWRRGLGTGSCRWHQRASPRQLQPTSPSPLTLARLGDDGRCEDHHGCGWCLLVVSGHAGMEMGRWPPQGAGWCVPLPDGRGCEDDGSADDLTALPCLSSQRALPMPEPRCPLRLPQNFSLQPLWPSTAHTGSLNSTRMSPLPGQSIKHPRVCVTHSPFPRRLQHHGQCQPLQAGLVGHTPRNHTPSAPAAANWRHG